MSDIGYIIGESNTEKVRDRIALILAENLANQRTLIEAETTPTPEMLLTLEAIPEKVFLERFVRPSEDEYPWLNVILDSSPLDELTGIESQTDIAKFTIQSVAKAKSTNDKDGDEKAAILLHRLLMLCRHIIMSPVHITLDFEPGFIGSVTAGNLLISQPDKGIDNGYLIGGQITVAVKIEETQNKIEGVPLNESGTTHKLYDTEKGFYYEIQ